MQIYKLFGSLQYKVVKISHILGNFFYSADFTYINNTKKAVSKSQQPKTKWERRPKLFCVKISIQKIPPQKISYQENCIKRGIFRNAMCEKAEFT